MRANRQNHNRFAGLFAAALACLFSMNALTAETLVLQLKTGERIFGTMLSENTNRVVISNAWVNELSIPLAQIEKRETNTSPATNIVSSAAISNTTANSSISATNVKTGSTNVVAASGSQTKPSSPPKTVHPKLWHAQVDVGVDLLYGAKERQIYNGRVKLTYARPYSRSPSKFLRNTLDYLAEYAETDGVLSGNRMEGSDKIDFDVGKKIFVYNAVGAGYDKIRKIDLHYEAGPGVGYHLFTLTNFVMNVESGFNYQVQDRSVGEDKKDFYFRFAEDFTWKLPVKLKNGSSVTLTEKFELFPKVENFSEYRARFESKLSFPLLKNLTFSFSVIDLYDTQPAPNVSENELQVRSTIGVTF
jgi:hypothetical protein